MTARNLVRVNEVRSCSAELQSYKDSALLSAVPAAWLGLGLSPASVASHNPGSSHMVRPACPCWGSWCTSPSLAAELHPGEGGYGPRKNKGVVICNTALAQHLPSHTQNQFQETNAVTAACALDILIRTMKLINANQK